MLRNGGRTSASGTYRGAEGKSASYTLAMSYDNMHRIKSKSQHLTQQGVQFDGTLNAGYDLTYTYQDSLGHKFQLSKIEDLNYRTEGTTKEKIGNGHRYLYDANGNLVYINTGRVKKDGKEDEQAVEKKYRWDEENRLLASDENGFVANYWYDADGERTVKSSGEGEQIYVNCRASREQCQARLSFAKAQPTIIYDNSEFSGGVTNTAKFSLYVSPYLVASQGGKYTKHIYIGSQRIVSKLGDLASYGADPRRIPYAGTEADGVSVDYQTKYNRQQQAIKDNYADFGVPYNGEDNNDYVNGEGFCCNDGTPTVAHAKAARSIEGNFKPNDDYEKMQFYYHPDHLGSSSYITNLDGEVVQHIEYVPFGEVFIEERNNTWNTPYLFNAKEYDEETGMYYYGARYYEPRISLWMSVDPRSEEAPEVSSYVYAHNSPTSRVDLDGKWDIKVSASSNRAQHPYAVYAVYDRKGNLIYKTVVKVLGSRRKRNQTNADTPQGLYKILEWRKTGTKRYPQISFGPNDLLALEYQGGEGGSRQGMHTHGGRRQQPDLMGTHGCMRIADADIKELKEIVTMLEQNDPKEKMGFLTLTDDLQTPVSFKDRERIKEEVYPNMLPEVVVVGHKPQKSEKSETKNEGTKDEVH